MNSGFPARHFLRAMPPRETAEPLPKTRRLRACDLRHLKGEAPWFWGMNLGAAGPHFAADHGLAATREDAMAAYPQALPPVFSNLHQLVLL